MKKIKLVLCAITTLFLSPAVSHAQQTAFIDFSTGLTGWTINGSAVTYNTTRSFIMGSGGTFSLTPFPGQTMAELTPIGSTLNITGIDAVLGLGNGTILGVIGPGVVSGNFGTISKSFTFSPGTYSFAWAYAAQDVRPYTDGVLFSVAGGSLQTVQLLARIGDSSIIPPVPGYPAGTVVVPDYGTTSWVP